MFFDLFEPKKVISVANACVYLVSWIFVIIGLVEAFVGEDTINIY